MRFLPLCVVGLCLVLAQCAPSEQSQQGTSAGSPSPAATASTSPVPVTPAPTPMEAKPSPSPHVAPTAAPRATASASVHPNATPDDVPKILAISIDKTTVQAGDVVSGDVTTSTNVASVEAQIANFVLPVPKVGPGVFALKYIVPQIPIFLRHTYTMNVAAHTSSGRTAHGSVAITIR